MTAYLQGTDDGGWGKPTSSRAVRSPLGAVRIAEENKSQGKSCRGERRPGTRAERNSYLRKESAI